jgi:Putative zinc-finger
MARLFTRWRREVVCREAVALMSDYLDGVLPPRQRARLERHLAACDGCDEYLRQLGLVIGLLGRAQPEDLSPETRDGLAEVWLEYRRETEGDGEADGEETSDGDGPNGDDGSGNGGTADGRNT